MSDKPENNMPSAVAGTPTDARGARPGSKPDSSNLPPQLNSLLSTTDQSLVRLAKLLAGPGGLESFLSTLNYSLYIVAYLHANAPAQTHLLPLLRNTLAKYNLLPTNSTVTAPTPIATLATNISQARTTLRLLGLLPLYTQARNLLTQKQPSDPWLHRIALLQCAAYVGYQSLENVAHLIDIKVLAPTTILNLRGYNPEAPSKKLWLIACRFWALGTICTILNVARQSQLAADERRASSTGQRKKVTQEEIEAQDKQWYRDLFTASSWWPLCMHFSIDGGLSGLNLGLVGLCGVAGGWTRTLDKWDATKEVVGLSEQRQEAVSHLQGSNHGAGSEVEGRT